MIRPDATDDSPRAQAFRRDELRKSRHPEPPLPPKAPRQRNAKPLSLTDAEAQRTIRQLRMQIDVMQRAKPGSLVRAMMDAKDREISHLKAANAKLVKAAARKAKGRP